MGLVRRGVRSIREVDSQSFRALGPNTHNGSSRTQVQASGFKAERRLKKALISKSGNAFSMVIHDFIFFKCEFKRAKKNHDFRSSACTPDWWMVSCFKIESITASVSQHGSCLGMLFIVTSKHRFALRIALWN